MVYAELLSKSLEECLEVPVSRFQDIQVSLTPKNRQGSIIRNRLPNPVSDFQKCRLAYHKPDDTVHGVRSDLCSFFSTGVTIDLLVPVTVDLSSTLFTDSRYFLSDGDRRSSTTTNSQHRRNKRSCFVCGKTVCWSTPHGTKERFQALKNCRQIRQIVTELIFEKQIDDNGNRKLTSALEKIMVHMLEEGQAIVNDAVDSYKIPTEDSNISLAFRGHILKGSAVRAIPSSLFQLTPQVPFKGIRFDTGASLVSSGNINQYMVYCTVTGTKPRFDESKRANMRFGIGKDVSKGMDRTESPVDDTWLAFRMPVVNSKILIQICIDDTEELGGSTTTSQIIFIV